MTKRSRWRVLVPLAASVIAGVSLLAAPSAGAAPRAPSFSFLLPGNLLVSRSVYTARPGIIVPGTTVLPPGCTAGCAVATASGAYPQVFNNVLADPAFGVTSPVFLDQLTTSGRLIDTTPVPAAGGLVTSFSSKSELALNLSTSGREVSFMGYAAAPGTVDVSNANTPGVIDPTNPVPGAYYRVAAQLDVVGQFRFTDTNAYSGDNGRAVILNDSPGANVLYAAGNAGNGSSPEPDGVIAGAGAQMITPSSKPERAQQPGAPMPVGSFSVTQLGDKADKVGKDTNFRGMTVFNNVLYYSKDSGSNGVNTVYFVDTTGKACPDGVGVPEPGAKLPTSPIAFDPAQLQAKGVFPDNMCILAGFPTALKSATSFPAALWFASASTLYVADEGNGDATFSTASGAYTAAAAQPTAGLPKWVLSGGTWKLAYTLAGGLNLGIPYTVRGYPAGDNAATGLPWSPATDGLRNITGRVNPDGTATIWAITATVSGSGDPGADPNKLVAVTDRLAAATAPAGERFTTVDAAKFGAVLRGVSFTPGTAPPRF
jgi:hypothetical protein